MQTFPTKEELAAMPLNRLRLVDIHNKEEEKLVQEITDAKFEAMPVKAEVYRGDVPDIKTPEQEKEWQAKIDARTAAIKARGITAEVPPESTTPGAPNSDISSTTAGETIPAEIPAEPEVSKTEAKRFCEFCDAKGPIKHKKNCTK